MLRTSIQMLQQFSICVVATLLFVAVAQAEDAADPPPSERSTTDDDLLKKLIGDDTQGKGVTSTPLERAIREMGKASTRIDEQDTGEITRGIQQDVVKNLEEFIQLVKQHAQKRPSGGGSSNPQPEDSGMDPDNTAKPEEGQPEDSGKTRDDKSSDSSDETRKSEDRQVKPVSSGRMVRDVWGHLPPALRQKLLNVYEDKYLPQYSDLVRRYFESLAEEGRPAPRKK